MDRLLTEIGRCTLCQPHLPHRVRPVVTASRKSRIVVVGQAPGRLVHESGIPWDDKSGDRLREWMGVDKTVFYDPLQIALIPMGFCYPGKGTSGDLPPRRECAPQWHARLLEHMPGVKLIILVGNYAQNYYLKDRRKKNLTETLRHFREYLPNYFVLPHSSPRNNIWLRKNPWFEEKLIPELRGLVSLHINAGNQ